MTLSEQEVDELLYLAIVANTGAYLLRKLRQNKSVQRLFRELPAGDLEAYANRLFSGEMNTTFDLASAYSILGVVSFCSADERIAVLGACRPERINLGPQIVAEMRAYAPSASMTTARVDPKILALPSVQTSAPVSRTSSLPRIKRIESSSTTPPSTSVSLNRC